MLLEAGMAAVRMQIRIHAAGGSLPTDVAILEQSTGISYNARAPYTGTPGRAHNQANQRFSVSYVTGSHAFKTGVQTMEGWDKSHTYVNDIPGIGPVTYRFNNGVPNQLTQFRSPDDVRFGLMPSLGIFAQDQWTLKRLTLNLGVRYDHIRAHAPAQTQVAVPAFGIPEINFPAVENVPNWHDIVPRLGAAYDLFGTGKTAVKASLGKYNLSEVGGLASNNAPAARISDRVTRTWADANRDFRPDCDLKDPLPNGECGRISDLRFGQPIPSRNYDPDYLRGWGVRGTSWQGALSVQQELRPNLAMNVGYYRASYGNFTVTRNRATSPSDYSLYCVTAPSDPRLGEASGRQICGMKDVVPSKFGQIDDFVTAASNFGEQSETFDGVDVAVNWRLGRGGVLQGGVSTGRTVTDDCEILAKVPEGGVTSQQGLNNALLAIEGANASLAVPFCHQQTPYQTQVKLLGTYTIPRVDVQLAATFQSIPGPQVQATYVVPNALVQPSLGRPLSGNASNVSVNVVAPGSFYGDRLHQTDFRVGKVIRFSGDRRITAGIDLYNLFNVNAVLAESSNYSSLRAPTRVVGARLIKFTLAMNF
jgi:hypothetical protein